MIWLTLEKLNNHFEFLRDKGRGTGGGTGIHLPFPAVLLHAEDTPRINFRANKPVKQKYISEVSAIKLSHSCFKLLYSRQKIFLWRKTHGARMLPVAPHTATENLYAKLLLEQKRDLQALKNWCVEIKRHFCLSVMTMQCIKNQPNWGVYS